MLSLKQPSHNSQVLEYDTITSLQTIRKIYTVTYFMTKQITNLLSNVMTTHNSWAYESY
jgi:hypothetical protein